MAYKIVLDAGHGGSNPGAVYQGRRESDDTLKLATAVGRILEENGYDVVFTRTTDTTQSVGQKAAIANEEQADLFISIHRNAAEYPGQYSGVQTLLYDDSGMKRQMADQINENLANVGFRNAGISIRPNLVVLNSTEMPSLLLEVGFIDSEKDNALLDSRFQAIAQAIADGIMETLEPAGSTPMSSTNMQDMDTEDIPPYTRPTPPPPGMWTGPDTVRPMPVLPDEEPDEEPGCGCKVYYRVQTGAFSSRENAEQQLQQLLADGLPAYLLYTDGLYKVQVGAFLKLTNAINMERQVRDLGYSTYITT
ncbi:MAG: N-acetylmuramoyl-L-alanine amidase [Lachnospiraceae bacterium]|jgi:N-acetylmuramoyl-L-alanine amidase|nr:N-acetylmuramoyl-L-alanine amidase [Lachnospiraceae bacterium]MCI8996849.1 N-acetylmuramoyl-L-alanine amidase [Lachnospiraceae bacterium]MCI9134945.1 N-acetylmuramoyl-L-alanine amidase [Lachnospiraceae bacterium]